MITPWFHLTIPRVTRTKYAQNSSTPNLPRSNRKKRVIVRKIVEYVSQIGTWQSNAVLDRRRRKQLKKIESSKAIGPDGISTKMLKYLGYLCTNFLTLIVLQMPQIWGHTGLNSIISSVLKLLKALSLPNRFHRPHSNISSTSRSVEDWISDDTVPERFLQRLISNGSSTPSLTTHTTRASLLF